jgi:hypothetical protein
MLDDDTAYELAAAMRLEFGPDDFDDLAPLVDAALVWLDGEARERIAVWVVEALWPRELREDIDRGLDAVAERGPRRLRARIARARADLAAGPADSRLARAVVDQAADERAFDLQLPVACPHCLDEGVERSDAPGRRERALVFARMAGHAAAVPDDELRAAVADGAAALELATDERRAEVRWWLRRVAMLGQRTIPHLSAALFELLDEPMPAAEHDEVWQVAVQGLERRLASRLQ